MHHKINYTTANTFMTRLLGATQKPQKNLAILFPNCTAIHTFFMKYPIHIIWLSKNFQIIKIDKHTPPRKIKTCKNATNALEITNNKIIKNIKTGDSIHKTKGQALLETALILPFLMILIFGFIQLGLTITEKQKLTYVAQYATQTGSITNNDTKIQGAITSFFPSTAVTIDIENKDDITNLTIPSANRRYNDTITVQIKKDFPLPIPTITPTSITLQAKSSARILCQNLTYPHKCN